MFTAVPDWRAADITNPACPPPTHSPTQGISKFLGGMLGAAFSPTKMLAYGLMATSVVNIAFGGWRARVAVCPVAWSRTTKCAAAR
jgi:hypothetical protein